MVDAFHGPPWKKISGAVKVRLRVGHFVVVKIGRAVVGPRVPDVLVVHLVDRNPPDLALVDVAQHWRPVCPPRSGGPDVKIKLFASMFKKINTFVIGQPYKGSIIINYG